MGPVAGTELVGGHPVVDFVNTLGGLRGGADDEHLHGYADLVAFAELAELLPSASAARLLRTARRRRAEAAEAFDAGLALRRSLDGVLRSHLDGSSPAAGDLDGVRRAYVPAVREAELRPAGGRYGWHWPGDELERPVQVLAVRAVELLGDAGLDRLRGCGRCRRMFLDTSRNRTRRWCSMQTCGAVEKMRRYRATRRS